MRAFAALLLPMLRFAQSRPDTITPNATAPAMPLMIHSLLIGGDGTGVGVGVSVGAAVGITVTLGVAVGVDVGVGVTVGVGVGIGVGVGDGPIS